MAQDLAKCIPVLEEDEDGFVEDLELVSNEEIMGEGELENNNIQTSRRPTSQLVSLHTLL